MVDDAGQHRGHDHGLGDALAAGGVEPDLGIEGVEIDDAPAGIEVGEQIGHSGDVVRRHGDERRLFGLGAGELDRADHIRGEMTVTQDGGLGGARGARGVEQHRDVLGIDERRQFDVGGGERGVEHGASVDGHGRIGADHRKHLGDDDGAGVGLDQWLQLLGAESVVERDERDAGVRRREQRDGERHIVGAAVDDAGGAHVEEPSRHTTGGGVEFDRGQRDLAGDDSDALIGGR